MSGAQLRYIVLSNKFVVARMAQPDDAHPSVPTTIVQNFYFGYGGNGLGGSFGGVDGKWKEVLKNLGIKRFWIKLLRLVKIVVKFLIWLLLVAPLASHISN